MKISVLYFATLRDRVGRREEEIEIPEGISAEDLKTLVSELHPEIREALPTTILAVNREYVGDAYVIMPSDEVALFPPVSGGEDLPTELMVTEAELDLNEVLEKIICPTTGAACVFTGMVRAQTVRGERRSTAYLEYEAYVPMAEAKMAQVADEIRERWASVEGIAIVQRIGVLEPGTPTVLIACTAAHRDTGVFEAARYGIDRLKEIVPIWKKEVGPGGETWVEGKYIPSESDKRKEE
jgi:molybdopterin converting factor subunit 1